MVLVAAMLLSSGSLIANGPEGSDPAQELQEQVKTLLDGYYEMPSHESFKATVLFTINREKEIVVLSVRTTDQKFRQFVKHRLNYREVKTKGIVEGRRYVIPVEVKV